MASKEPIQILIATSIHRDGIVKLAETSLVPYEPSTIALGLTWESGATGQAWWEKAADMCIKERTSHIAINSNNEVIGYLLSRILDTKTLSRNNSFCEFAPKGSVSRDFRDQLTQDWAKVLPPTEKIFHLMGLCVHQDYGGRGIGLQLTKENLELGKQIGCGAAAVVATNWISQIVFEKAGMVEISSLKFEDFRDGNGKQAYFIKDPKQHSAKFYVKVFE